MNPKVPKEPFNPVTGGGLWVQALDADGNTLWGFFSDGSHLMETFDSGGNHTGFEVSDEEMAVFDLFKRKTDAFDLPSLYYQTVRHSTRLFHDVDFETVGGDTLLLKMKKFSFGMDKGSLGALNEPVKTLEFFGNGVKYSFKLYENGFIPSGSGFAGQTLEEAYGFTENPEEWKQILETLNAAYQDFAPNYGASWLGLVNPDRVTDLSIALNGTKATYAQNDRTDEITSIVHKLRGILVEDNPSSSAEKPTSVPGTLSLTLDFYTGIQYEITIHNGELKIYASDVGKTLTYKIKDNDPYDALLPYVSGTQEVNYITG